MEQTHKAVRVACEGKLFVPLHELRGTQGGLKEFTSTEDREKFKNLLIEDGIDFVMTVWRGVGPGEEVESWWLIDGHGRKEILEELEREGFSIPHIPVAQNFAPSFEEARAKVLPASASFHRMTNKGLAGFMETTNLGIARLDKFVFTDVSLANFKANLALPPAPQEPVVERDADNTKEGLDTYKNNSIRQIVLYFQAEKFELMLGKLDQLMGAWGLTDYSEVVERMTEENVAKLSAPAA